MDLMSYIWKYVYTDTYMHAVTADEKRGMDLKESREEYVGRLGGRIGESKTL